MKRPRALFALCCALVSLLAAPALGDIVKIVVPFAAGGPVDQLARILSNDLGAKLGADVIVDDRGGAGGAIGAEFVARAAPDGNTMLLCSLGSCVLSPILKPPAAYDPVKSFVPVMLVGERVKERVNLAVLRDGAARMIASLPPALRALDKAGKAYPVVASDWLRADAAALGARLTRADGDHKS